MDIFFWITSKFDNFYGLSTKVNYCYLCSVMKFTLIHTTATIIHDGQGHWYNRNIFSVFFLSKISSFFGGYA